MTMSANARHYALQKWGCLPWSPKRLKRHESKSVRMETKRLLRLYKEL